MSQDGQLKSYEREILRARSRVQVADLDNEIDELIKTIIGKLTQSQHKIYQASRLADFMQITPEAIILRRAILLDLTDTQIKGLSAPDVLTMEELASLVVIMRANADWLKYQQNNQIDTTFQDLVNVAEAKAKAALDAFNIMYNRDPHVDDIPENVMKIAKARKIVRISANSVISLPEES